MAIPESALPRRTVVATDNRTAGRIAQHPPLSGLLHIGDIDDPRPWLEAYTAGVGSPLELKFLHLFQKHGFSPQKQVPVSPDGTTSPILSPSTGLLRRVKPVKVAKTCGLSQSSKQFIDKGRFVLGAQKSKRLTPGTRSKDGGLSSTRSIAWVPGMSRPKTLRARLHELSGTSTRNWLL